MNRITLREAHEMNLITDNITIHEMILTGSWRKPNELKTEEGRKVDANLLLRWDEVPEDIMDLAIANIFPGLGEYKLEVYVTNDKRMD